jgi:NAD(P)-dependent dehydrogenase (short-subunit alcohol dehydrogenase family)
MATALITGSSSGIGAAAAIELTRAGHRVLITGRSEAKLRAVRSALIAAAPPEADVPEPIQADLASLAEVRRLAQTVLEREEKLDVLINNAAVQPRTPAMSADGLELGLAVNHLAHQLLTMLLRPCLAESGGRVITTSSDEHAHGEIDFGDLPMKRHWSTKASYARSKLANVLFTTELKRQTGLPASSFHPGSVSTDLNRDARFVRLIRPLERMVMKTPQEGASTMIWLASTAEGGAPSATYYIDCAPAETSDAAADKELAGRLWDLSADMTRR